MAWSMNCCATDTSNAIPAPALPRTACTDLPPWAYPQPTRDSPGPIRQRLRRAHRGRGGSSRYGGDGTMQEEREEREQYMDSLEQQMEHEREQIQRTLERTTQD